MEKKLIVYYSYTNNTKKIAEQIQKANGADICEIETVKPYIGDYNSVVDQGKHDKRSEQRIFNVSEIGRASCRERV